MDELFRLQYVLSSTKVGHVGVDLHIQMYQCKNANISPQHKSQLQKNTKTPEICWARICITYVKRWLGQRMDMVAAVAVYAVAFYVRWMQGVDFYLREF